MYLNTSQLSLKGPIKIKLKKKKDSKHFLKRTEKNFLFGFPMKIILKASLICSPTSAVVDIPL